MLADDGLLAEGQPAATVGGKSPIRPRVDPSRPFAARDPHFPKPRAKNVVVIFCSGACSHLDTFDYKPELIKRHGQPLPGADELITFQGAQGNLTQSPWKFRPRGKSGKMISDLVPQLGGLADDMCFVHSLTSRTNTHGPGENFMSTGFTLDGFPAMGAWVTWALGSDNEELPSYVAIPDPRGTPQSSVNNWGPGFLPAAFQGTDFNAAKPIRNLSRPPTVERGSRPLVAGFPEAVERAAPAAVRWRQHSWRRRIASYELAAKDATQRPQSERHLVRVEPTHMLKMYGADDVQEQTQGMRSLAIASLPGDWWSKGVRFVQLFNGAYQTGGEGVSNWDGHKKLKRQYAIFTVRFSTSPQRRC